MNVKGWRDFTFDFFQDLVLIVSTDDHGKFAVFRELVSGEWSIVFIQDFRANTKILDITKVQFNAIRCIDGSAVRDVLV